VGKMTRSEVSQLGGARTKQIWEERYLKNPKLCKQCGEALSFPKRKNKFCNCSCAASFNNLGVSRNTGVVVAARKAIECLNCGKETMNFRYCSKQCYHEKMKKEYVAIIEATGCLPPTNTIYGYSPQCAKRYLKECNGVKCEICGITEWIGQEVPLVLDHKNGNPTDHSVSNLRLVCGNCNMLLPTFAGKNKGRGRRTRRS